MIFIWIWNTWGDTRRDHSNFSVSHHRIKKQNKNQTKTKTKKNMVKGYNFQHKELPVQEVKRVTILVLLEKTVSDFSMSMFKGRISVKNHPCNHL